MPDYKKMYIELLKETEEVIERLKEALQRCEDIYVETCDNK